MRMVVLVARHELLTHLRRRSFLFTTALVPILGLAISLVGGIGGALVAGDGTAAGLGAPGRPPGTLARIGYVDPAGFVTRQPPGAAGDSYQRYTDRTAAGRALADGEIDVVYLLPAAYPRDRTVVRIAPGLTLAAADGPAFETLLRANLWPQADAAQLADLANPGRRVIIHSGLRAGSTDGNAVAADSQRFIVPVAVGVLIYSTIFMLSSFLLQSVTTEKENRIVEILLTSVRPSWLLGGKVLGLALLGLLQIGVWTGLGLLLPRSDSLALAQRAVADLGAPVVLLALAYFLLGFLFYASLMAAVGALAPSFQESGPLTFVVLAPAWLPFILLGPLLRAPDAPPARILSVLPPTAPLVMLLRTSSGPVPRAEIALSLLLLIGATAAVLWLTARLFRASMLLAGSLPGPGEVIRALRI